MHLIPETGHIALEVVVMMELKYYNHSATEGRGKRGRESCYFFGPDYIPETISESCIGW